MGNVLKSDNSEKRIEYFIYKKKDISTFKGTVLLGHAMFNSCDYYKLPLKYSFVNFLQKSGYDVVMFNHTGFGQSTINKKYRKICFDDYVDDYNKIYENILVKMEGPLFYIGHSIGSVAGISAFQDYPFKKTILIAPALWTFLKPVKKLLFLKQYSLIMLTFLVSSIRGKMGPKLLNLGNTSMPAGHFRQYRGWVKSREITSRDGSKKYCRNWSKIDKPILILSGSMDKLMAPKENITWLHNKLHPKSKVETVSKDNGYGFNGEHFNIIYGKNASVEIWPKIAEYLKK